MSLLRRAFKPIIRPVLHCYFRFARPLTLGAFGMVIDGTGRVFLVKHSYIDGWHLPGGGVEPGETVHSALARELAEEGNIKLKGQPQLFSIYFNQRISRRDHVVLFVVRDFHQESVPEPSREIIEHGFFALDALPPDTGRATRARLDEVFKGVSVSEMW